MSCRGGLWCIRSACTVYGSSYYLIQRWCQCDIWLIDIGPLARLLLLLLFSPLLRQLRLQLLVPSFLPFFVFVCLRAWRTTVYKVNSSSGSSSSNSRRWRGIIIRFIRSWAINNKAVAMAVATERGLGVLSRPTLCITNYYFGMHGDTL